VCCKRNREIMKQTRDCGIHTRLGEGTVVSEQGAHMGLCHP
jgi:hypothetical protein